jgi:hypothetical protein
MLAGRVDGVSADEGISSATLDSIRVFSQVHPTYTSRRTIPNPLFASRTDSWWAYREYQAARND